MSHETYLKRKQALFVPHLLLVITMKLKLRKASAALTNVMPDGEYSYLVIFNNRKETGWPAFWQRCVIGFLQFGYRIYILGSIPPHALFTVTRVSPGTSAATSSRVIWPMSNVVSPRETKDVKRCRKFLFISKCGQPDLPRLVLTNSQVLWIIPFRYEAITLAYDTAYSIWVCPNELFEFEQW